MISWVYRVVIDEKPDQPPPEYRDHHRYSEGGWLTREQQWKYYGTQQWARRRFLDLGAARGVAIIHASNGVRSHIERAPIGPWEEV